MLRAYKQRINGFWVYGTKKPAFRRPKKPSPLLETLDLMKPGQWMVGDLQKARLIKAMVARRTYNVRQEKIRDGEYRMIKC